MADKDSTESVVTPMRTSDEERAETHGNTKTSEPGGRPDSRNRPARPDPKTGEVPAGPGDAGLQDRPDVNQGSPGSKQISSHRLLIGVGIAVFLTILVIIVELMF